MSIINDMLRDLEDRDAPETPGRPVRRRQGRGRGPVFGWTVASAALLGSVLAWSVASEPVRRWAEAWHMSRFAALPIAVQDGVSDVADVVAVAGIDVASPPPLSNDEDQPGTRPGPEVRSLVFEGDHNRIRIEIDVLGSLVSEPYPVLSDRLLEIVIDGAAISPAFDPIAIPLGDAPWLQGLDLLERDDGVVVRVKLSDAVDLRTQLIRRERGTRIAFSLSHPRALPRALDPAPLPRMPAVSANTLRTDLPGIPAPPLERRRLAPRGAVVAVSYPDAAPAAAAQRPSADPADSRMIRTQREPNAVERADAAYHRARVLLRQGDSATAVSLLQGAIRDDPGHAEARGVLARNWIAAGRRAEAKEILRAGREHGAISTLGTRLLAGLLADEGRSTEALEVLAGSGVEAIDSADHHALQATLLQDLGRHEEAAATWRNVLQLDSRRADAWMGLGWSSESLGRREQAHTAYRAALRVGGLEEAPAQWVAGRVEALAP